MTTDMKCEVCKDRFFTIIVDGIKMCISCYDEMRRAEKLRQSSR